MCRTLSRGQRAVKVAQDCVARMSEATCGRPVPDFAALIRATTLPNKASTTFGPVVTPASLTRWQATRELNRFDRRIKTRGMEAMSKVSRLVAIVVLSLIASSAQLAAQAYPDRVVRIINPYPPGGSVDVMARILAQKLSDNLGEQFKSMAKIDIVHVPYRGAGPAMNDLVGGHVQMFFDLMPVVLPQINAGKVHALGNAGSKRPAALPDVPTIAEQGLAGFDASSWYGLVAPAKTPEPVLAKLRDEVAKALKAPVMVARIRELGSEPGTIFGAEFGAFMAAETKKWAEVIHASGAKAD